MLDESFNELMVVEDKNSDDFKKTLQGIHSYDILRNPQYIASFQYFSADLPDRDDFIIDDDDDNDNNNAQSDFCRIVLSLAYVRPHVLDDMTLDAKSIMKMAKNPQET